MMIPPLVGNLPCLKDLAAVLFECFLIISLGYLSCRFKLTSAKAKDLNSYLTTFALPMIIFLNIAQMEFQTINLSFLFCMLTAKLLVFILVTILSLIISYPTNFGYAGALSILATQSNDFALGYPLIKSLYGDSRSEMLNYLSLMAPIQLLILNPLGIVMLEYEKSRRIATNQPEASDDDEVDHDDQSQDRGEFATCRCQRRRSQQQAPANESDDRKGTEHVSFIGCDPEAGRRRSDDSFTRQHIRRRTSVSEESLLANKQIRMATKINRNIKSLKLVMPLAAAAAPATSMENILQSSESEVRQMEHNQTCCCSCGRLTGADSPGRHSKCAHQASSGSPVNLNFLYALATNPLIIASVVALSVNLIHGPELPKLVTKVSNTIAASFAAPALFVVGSSMAGKFQLLIRNPNDLILSSALVLTKLLLLPSLMRTLASIILPAHTPADEIPFLIDFSFLYGLLPTAPTACIIAKQYGVLTNVVAISMILSTFLSAPLTLAASVIINPGFVVQLEEIQLLMSQTLRFSGLLTLALAAAVLLALWRSKRRLSYTKFINLPLEVITCKIKTNPTHVFLFLLAGTQILIGLAGTGWFFMDAGSAADQPLLLTSGLKSNANFSASDPETLPLSLPAPIPTGSGGGSDADSDDNNPDESETHASGFQNTLNQVTMERLATNSATGDTFDCLQYVLASSGVLLARLVILCILITTAAIRFKGYTTATRISSVLVKGFLLVGLALVLWLAFEAQQLPIELLHFPMESTIPSNKRSLYIRLIYDTLFMLLAVPLFALIIRSDNRSKRLLESLKVSSSDVFVVDSELAEERASERPIGRAGGELIPVAAEGCSQAPEGQHSLTGSRARNFITSSMSLSSETSSAMTTNTSFDSSPGQELNNNNHNHNNNSDFGNKSPAFSNRQLHSDSVSVNLIDGVNFMPTISRRALNSFMTSNQQQQQQQTQILAVRQDNLDLEGSSRAAQQELPSEHPARRLSSTLELKRKSLIGLIQMSEFNKYSILILFMLITTTLNLTSMVQKLAQDKPFGTFRQIEVMSVAMDFGQGLLTFLIYGFRGLAN